MKQIEVENQLRSVVGRLMAEIDLATSQGRSDVYLISEDAWIPVLQEVYQCPNLINLNRTRKNFPGVDLGDENERVAFQVTASTDIDKIKSTLEQFKKSNLKDSFDELYIFTLRPKQKSYSQQSIDRIIGDEMSFDTKKHIIDPSDVLSVLTGLRLGTQERMLKEFKKILGDANEEDNENGPGISGRHIEYVIDESSILELDAESNSKIVIGCYVTLGICGSLFLIDLLLNGLSFVGIRTGMSFFYLAPTAVFAYFVTSHARLLYSLVPGGDAKYRNGTWYEKNDIGAIYSYRKFAKCIYPKCEGRVRIIPAPPRERHNHNLVGACSVGGMRHSFTIDHNSIGYAQSFDWRPPEETRNR